MQSNPNPRRSLPKKEPVGLTLTLREGEAFGVCGWLRTGSSMLMLAMRRKIDLRVRVRVSHCVRQGTQGGGVVLSTNGVNAMPTVTGGRKRTFFDLPEIGAISPPAPGTVPDIPARACKRQHPRSCSYQRGLVYRRSCSKSGHASEAGK